MTRPQHIKDTVVRSLFTVGCRGKKRTNISPTALKLLTALVNVLAQETLQRTAESCVNEGRTAISKEDLQRVIAQIMLDFST